MANSTWIEHCYCPVCESVDNASLYADGSKKCHKCGWKEIDGEAQRRKHMTGLVEVEIKEIPHRRLTEETCKIWRYGYGTVRGNRVHVATHFDNAGNPIAQKIRSQDKKFSWLGDHSRVGLYGQWLWGDGGHMLVVTEGEIDALSVSQCQDNRYPVVSVPDGSGSAPKVIKKALDWLEKFERVVFMFDMDEPGREAAMACALLLTPGKAFIAHLPEKDPNAMLMAGRAEKLKQAAWDAKPHSPDGIVTGDDIWSCLEDSRIPSIADFPWPEVQRRTKGMRKGDIVLLVGGIGSGKSSICRNLTSSLLDQGLKVGVLPLEETVAQFMVGLIGIRIGYNFHAKSEDPLAHEDLDIQKKFAEEYEKIKDRLIFYDDGGDRKVETIFERIKYMTMALDAQAVVIDHLTVLIGSSESDDDRRFTDRLMSQLEGLIKRVGAIALIVMHLKKRTGRAHEEGASVSMNDIRGSGMTGALSHHILAYERNQQGDEENTGFLRILKTRWTGLTGMADQITFDPDSGRISVYDELIDSMTDHTVKETDF